MKIKIGLKFKAIEDLAKGKEFTVTKVDNKIVTFRSEETGNIWESDRKHFEKYLRRVNRYWSEKNKSYKRKKNDLKFQ